MKTKDTTMVKIRCVFCGTVHTIEAPKDGLRKYETGEAYVQDCFPDMSPEIREMFISRMCSDCWDKTFSDE